MTWFLAGALSVAISVAGRAPSQDLHPVALGYSSVAEAVGAALSSQPVVVAFGEFHQTETTARIPSALHRFTDQVFPVLAPRLSHLVVETWVTTGRCGDAERVVTADVQKTTQRPPATAGEIETLIRAAATTGVTPRILSLTCADYESMRAPGNKVDYDRTLRVTERALEIAALRAFRELANRTTPGPLAAGTARDSFAAAPGQGPIRAPTSIAIYGGALHNDVHVDPALAAYSFASRLMAATLGRYVEIDFVVAAYATRNPVLRAQSWWPTYQRFIRSHPPISSVRRSSHGTAAIRTGVDAVMLRRSRQSYVIIFPAPAAGGP